MAYAGPRHLWFLWVLVFCYLIGILARWIHPGIIMIGLFAASVLLPLGSPPLTLLPRADTIAWAGSTSLQVLR